jgi:UDP-N-acetylmuramoyl-L-alanyl-D-glutamate--2,6-diaminopimelate ligase
MNTLSDILYKVKLLNVIGPTHIGIAGLSLHSGSVKKGFLFAAISGTQVDGHKFINHAIEMGATTILCADLPETRIENVTYVLVENTSASLGIVASNFYSNPSGKLSLIGITGTNGKTTVATLLFNLFEFMGYSCGLISTVENKIHDRIIPSTHTTPDVISINRLLAGMVEQGCAYCFMESSSHSIDQHRIAGLEFKGAVFTNITHDHLDYHGTFDHYLKTKKRLFDMLPAGAFALVNLDDRRGVVMLQNTKASKHTYAIKKPADFKAKVIDNTFDGLVLQLDHEELHSQLTGIFNAYNLLAVYAVSQLLGAEKVEALRALSAVKPASGRFDHFTSKDGTICIIDYAHTPDALQNILDTIKAIRTGNETLITVVGCGGDRDKGKRPLMAKISAKGSDKVVLTSDNPRSENPESIMEDMKKGIPVELSRKVLSIIDRKEAIKTAVMLANPGDIILVAGKGHEKYQDIKGVKFPFDDKAVLLDALKIKTP